MRYHSEEDLSKIRESLSESLLNHKRKASSSTENSFPEKYQNRRLLFCYTLVSVKVLRPAQTVQSSKVRSQVLQFLLRFSLDPRLFQKRIIFTFFFSKRIRIYPRIFEFPPIGDSHGTKGQRLTVCKSCDQILRRGSEMYFLAMNWSFLYEKMYYQRFRRSM